jgi:RimJ/RimL family protein N-acetyltransferase
MPWPRQHPSAQITDSIRLTELRVEDWAERYELDRDLRIARALCSIPRERQAYPEIMRQWVRQSAQDWVEERAVTWAIRDEERMIGCLALRCRTRRVGATIFVGVAPAERGQGIATLACQQACQLAVDPLGLTLLEIKEFSTNLAALAIARKAGFICQHQRLLDHFHEQSLYWESWSRSL